MPANLTPEYRKAEDRYRSASTDDEKLAALEEMLRAIPKHKGTDHMQADIKRKISKLRAASTGKKKGGGKHIDIFHVPPGGAGQIVLLGMPNCGKSAIVGTLSKAPVNVADYPFATDKPVPGMMKYEDVQIQLVDMPPITAEFAPPGIVNTYRGCDSIAIVIDLAGEVLEQMEVCLQFLDSHRLLLDEETNEKEDEGNRLGKPVFVVCTKADLAPEGTLETLQELCERPFEYLEVSPETGQGMEFFCRRVFERLEVVRVYAKKPGQDVDMTDPFTLPYGATVEDLAYQVHRELAEKLKSARAWQLEGIHDGQNVHRTQTLTDKCIIELHFN